MLDSNSAPESPAGLVFDVAHGSVHDGPGLRSVVFLKGCRMGCPWCHNPEGKHRQIQISFRADRCIGCGLCRRSCPRGRSRATAWRAGCTACGKCAATCPAGARQVVGRKLEIGDLVELMAREVAFFHGTKGGVTFSGGEPLLQPDFVLGAARALRALGIHTALQTAGGWSPDLVNQVSQNLDLVLFDLKHVDEARWSSALGPELQISLANLSHLVETDIDVEVSITMIPGFNDREEDLRAMGTWIARLPRHPPVTIRPFHRLARAKEQLFGLRYPYSRTSTNTACSPAEAVELLQSYGLDAVVD